MGFTKLQIANVELVHELLEHNWGQKVIRVYDQNYHIIEVGEDMSPVVKRLLHNGVTVEQVAKKMDVPVDYVQDYLEH